MKQSSEVTKARRKLFDKEIRDKNKRSDKLLKIVTEQRMKLKFMVRVVDFIKYNLIIDETISKLKKRWYSTHQNKFTGLRAHSRSDAGLLNPDSVITNLSDYSLSEVEKLALANGLKFSLPPKRLKAGNYLASFELLYNDLSKSLFNGDSEQEVFFKERLSDIGYSSYFNFNMSRHSLLNIPRDQYKALVTLSKNKDVIITNPDKGSGVVILNKTDYVKKMEEIINDTTKFKLCNNQDLYEVSRKIERKVRNFLLRNLKKPGLISDEEYKKLYPNGSHIGVLYGLPKVHKRDVPTRPICSAIGTSTYELGKFLSKIIKPAAACSLGTDLDNTFSFVEQISNQNLSNPFMVSFDVRSLFTNIPLKKTILICLDRLYRGDPAIRPYISEKTLEGLLKLCVCDNTFVFNGKVYQQIDGVAMGSSLGPILANIYMAHLEEEFFFKNSLPFSPTFYRRYVDDTFCLFTTFSSF